MINTDCKHMIEKNINIREVIKIVSSLCASIFCGYTLVVLISLIVN